MKPVIEQNDVLEWAKTYDGPKFHALLCDPPYELGFMGRQWDKSGIAFNSETWAALAEHLHPGAFGMAFASTRGWHRMAVAIEDAGLIIHPVVALWGFGSGFPKATRIDTQIDKAAGAEREIVGVNPNSRPNMVGVSAAVLSPQVDAPITAPATPLAATWEGHRYGLQAMKPAFEPCIVFQKPYKGKPVDCITSTGAGALWIDGARIGTRTGNESGWSKTGSKASENRAMSGANYDRPPKDEAGTGRWPSNIILVHTPDCTSDNCVEGCAVQRLGEQSGESVSSDRPIYHREFKSVAKGRELPHVTYGHSDSGTAARYFFQAQYDALLDADTVTYCAKASRKERDAGLEGVEPKQKVFNGQSDAPAGCAPGSVEDKFSTSPARNPHPTVKPISLIEHLTTLLLPPPEYGPRRILIPFSGSGSECIGAMRAGWEEVLGIEREEEYADIARRRIDYWFNKQSEPAETVQPDLFDGR